MEHQYLLDSPLVKASEELRAYAAPSFAAGRPLLEAVENLSHRIFDEFNFEPDFTDVTTPLSEVLKHRSGVCQDFAQVGVGCLRSLGLPGRYVSGYIETLPPPGEERMIGADASHAWMSVLLPGVGWVDFDPTNDQRRSERHIVVAHGRDFSDATPLKGVTYGGGQQSLSVKVDVLSRQ
jgi:transglutaminase-like putative cysteine protease